MPQSQQFLCGSVSSHAEIQNLDITRTESVAFPDPPFDDRPKGRFQGHLERFRHGIAQHSYSECVRRFCLGVLPIPQATAADSDESLAFRSVPSLRTGSERAPNNVVIRVEHRVAEAYDPQAELSNDERNTQACTDQYSTKKPILDWSLPDSRRCFVNAAAAGVSARDQSSNFF
jgi:hypothetical protein